MQLPLENEWLACYRIVVGTCSSLQRTMMLHNSICNKLKFHYNPGSRAVNGSEVCERQFNVENGKVSSTTHKIQTSPNMYQWVRHGWGEPVNMKRTLRFSVHRRDPVRQTLPWQSTGKGVPDSAGYICENLWTAVVSHEFLNTCTP